MMNSDLAPRDHWRRKALGFMTRFWTAQKLIREAVAAFQAPADSNPGAQAEALAKLRQWLEDNETGD